MGWEGGADIYDPIGLNISCFCAHLHLLVSISARLSPRRGLRRHSRSVSPPLSPIIFLHMLSLPHPSLSLCTLSFPPLRSIVSSRVRERGGSLSIVVSRIFSFSRQRLASTERTGVEKVDRNGQRDHEREREGGRKVGKEASRIILRMGGA